MTTRGRMIWFPHLPAQEGLNHLLGAVEIADDPILQGRTARILSGVRPNIRYASSPTLGTSSVLVLMATTEGSLSTMPWVLS